MCVLNTHTHPRTPSISWQRFHFSYLIKVDGKSFKLSIKNNTKSCHKSSRKAEPIYLSSQQGRQRKQVEEGEEEKQREGKREQANADLQRIEMEKFN